MATPVDSSVAPDLPRLTRGLRPLIERVAALRASVHTKLLGGFLVGAVLLLAMAALSLAVLAHMSDRVGEINLAQDRLDRLRQMDYLVIAQSHYRTMALLTHDDANNDLIARAKADFLVNLDAIDKITPDSERGILARVREANDRFTVSSAQVLELYLAGQDAEALRLHLAEEHPISHDIEAPMTQLLNNADEQMSSSQATFESDQRLLTGLVIGFSVVSLLTALLLGFVLSWSFLLPLGKVHVALARIAGGRFDEHVQLPNRDEFGTLAQNLNATSRELATIYGQLETLNANLRGTNTELLAQLQAQVVELARSRGLITQAEERLRRELAEVLHSRVQNRLLMVWYRIGEVEELLPTDAAAGARLLSEIRDQVDQIREQDVRELSHRLHPSIIRAGLLPALETLAEEMPSLSISIQADAEVEALDHSAQNGIPEEVRLTAYRVVEEALGNIVKHAAASRVDVILKLSSHGLTIDARDNGRGFDQHAARPGLGLGSIAARVGRVGGEWAISSGRGVGTCLSVVLPYSFEQVQDSLSAQATFWQEHRANADGGRGIAHVA
jgi:signal transduction histidine kinase